MDDINTQLYEKMTRLQWLMLKHHHRTRTEGGPMADTSRGQGRILAMLKLQDGISTKDLSYLLGIRVSSLNELLAKMEKNGYINREPDENDKRVMLVKLTEKGRDEPQREVRSGDIFECFSAAEKKVFGEYLSRIITQLAAEYEEETDDEREWWTCAARERMGDDMFERFASRARGGFSPGGVHHRQHHRRPGAPTPPEGSRRHED